MDSKNAFIERNYSPLSGNLSDIVVNEPLNHKSLLMFLASRKISVPQSVLSNGRYILRRDRACKMLYQSIILNDEFAARLYDDWIPPEYSLSLEKLAQVNNPTRYNGSLSLLLSICRERRPYDKSVLDFGSGWGGWAMQARALGFDVITNELSPARTEYLRSCGFEVITSELFDQASISEEKYDFIHANQVFEHLAKPLPTLRKLVDKLKPGGYIYLSVPDVSSLYSLGVKVNFSEFSQGQIKKMSPLNHINGFTPTSLRHLCKLCNLVEAKIRPEFRGLNQEKSLLGRLNRITFPFRRTTSAIFLKPHD